MTAYELYEERYPSKVDDVLSIDPLIFDSDGNVDWSYISHSMSNSDYDELYTMGVFDDLEDITIELLPGMIFERAMHEGRRFGMSGSEVIHKAFYGEWLAYEPDTELYALGMPLIFSEGNSLMHYGTPRHSGRYPWGSGENPYQRYGDLYSNYNRLKAEHPDISEKELARQLGVVDKFGKPSVTILRRKYSNARAEKRMADVATAQKYKDEGKGNSEIGRLMGINESSVRSLLDEKKKLRTNLNQETADVLAKYADKYKYIDISSGVESKLGVTKTRLDNAVDLLEEHGYSKHTIQIDQMGTNHKTTVTVLTKPGVEYSELSENRFDIRYPGQDSRVINSKGDITTLGLRKPDSVSSDRIMVRYTDENGKGGAERDGLIELRRGVDDISLGGAQYAQVRIAVDDTHYLKGMARYSDDMPPGVDIIFNTNKKDNVSKLDTFKKMKTVGDTDKVDWENPFGASVTQREYIGDDGKPHISPVNIVREEGEWQKWSKNLASQMLSKQPVKLAQRQLNYSYQDRKVEFEEIKNLENPAVKKKLLLTYADACDQAAVELKASPFAKQQTHVILPYPELKDTECYAPNYKDGTKLALIRYPHGGTFEIPILTVRNTGSPAEKSIRNAPDAIGINANVAGILSGADFDGDTVTAIPLSDKVKIRSKDPLDGLKGFDPKDAYPGYEGMTPITPRNKQMEMGKVSNLITDMTLKGASDDEIVRAVKHSMVVIDSEKHKLNYRQSEIDNNIAELKRLYQGKDDGSEGGGASTIISKAKSEYRVDARKDWYASSKSIGPNGEKIYTPTNETVVEGKLKGIKVKDGGRVIINTERKTGLMYYVKDDETSNKKVRVYITEDDLDGPLKTTLKTQKSTKMAEATDAYELTSGGSRENPGYAMEGVYADYANHMKALANAARKEWANTKNLEYNKEAAVKYKDEVASLNEKLRVAKAHSADERQAQLLANKNMSARLRDNPDMGNDEKKKYKAQAINAARSLLGVQKKNTIIDITDREWEAIQSGAVSHSKAADIFENVDLDKLKERATPRAKKTITPSMKALAKGMHNAGFTTAQIADRLGISASSVYTITSGKE